MSRAQQAMHDPLAWISPALKLLSMLLPKESRQVRITRTTRGRRKITLPFFQSDVTWTETRKTTSR